VNRTRNFWACKIMPQPTTPMPVYSVRADVEQRHQIPRSYTCCIDSNLGFVLCSGHTYTTSEHAWNKINESEGSIYCSVHFFITGHYFCAFSRDASSRMSVHRHVRSSESSNWFSRNFVLENSSNICVPCSVLIRIRQQQGALYLKTHLLFCAHLSCCFFPQTYGFQSN
jgi:hypothetical protein